MGESGEVAELLKKHMFHQHPLDETKLKKEIGDVLWYTAYLAKVFDFDLNEIAELNIAKLKARYPDGFTPELSQNRKPEDN